MKKQISLEEKNKRRYEMQESTKLEAVSLLNKYGKCLMVRPTGTGKTHIMAELSSEYDWDKVFFVYPTNAVRDQVSYEKDMRKNDVVSYISYKLLDMRVKSGDFIESLREYEKRSVLFLFDEAHLCGAEERRKSIKLIMDEFPQFCYLGATATPDRGDGYDVLNEIFDGQKVYDYSRHRAICEGILEQPYYVASRFDIVRQFKELGIKKLNNQKLLTKEKKIEYMTYIKNKALELTKYEDLSNVLKENINNLIEDTSYMKFLVFFSTVNLINEKKDEVISWFKKAFPNMRINTLVVVLGNKSALKEATGLIRRDGVIDLVFCIDMFTYGYHVDDITGEIMMRFTKSDIVLNQQVGRCLSTMSNDRKIIFDFIGNSNISTYFDSLEDEEVEGKNTKVGDSDSGDLTDVFYKGDLIRVDTNIIDINEMLRFCDYDELALEKAVARAVKYKNMPLEIAIKELKQYGVTDKDSLMVVLDRYKGI